MQMYIRHTSFKNNYYKIVSYLNNLELSKLIGNLADNLKKKIDKLVFNWVKFVFFLKLTLNCQWATPQSVT